MTAIQPIETPQDAQRVVDLSKTRTVVIYKHSPICSISETAIMEFETFAGKSPAAVELFRVDVIAARPASLQIEALTGVRHESPQILVMAEGAVVWHASHRRIRADELAAQVDSLSA